MVEGIDTGKLRLFPIEKYSITVTDGDTILLIGEGKRISVRLAGIDAPELAKPGLSLGQTGSLGAMRYLQTVITKYRHQLRLYVDPSAKTHGRLVGVLTAGDRNINLELVSQGLASAYKPKGKSTVNYKTFSNAEKVAVGEGRGIYGSKYFQAKYAHEMTTGKRMTNVALSDTGSNFTTRVHNKVIKGMAAGDHRKSTYGGFIGMQTNRPDFGASNTPGNPASMGIVQQMFKSLGVKADLLMSFDIETTGLDFSDVTTFAGFSDISFGGAPTSMESFINPKLPIGAGGNDAMSAMLNRNAEHRFRRQAANSAMKTGGQMTNVLPGGQQMDTDWVRGKLQQSSMSSSMKAEQLALMQGSGIDPEDFMSQLFNKFKGKKNGFVFIHNAQFESGRMGAAIPENVWKNALQSGDLAAGNTARRYLYNDFDESLATHKQASRLALQSGDTAGVAKSQAAWMNRFSDVLTGRATTASGVKVIDTQDIAKGVFAQAHLAGHFQTGGAYSTHGLVSQDSLTTLLGMGSERHMPVSDAEQNLEMVARMMGFSDEMKAGNLSSEGKAFFKKAGSNQRDMQFYSLYRDINNQLRGVEKGMNPLTHEIPMRGDVPLTTKIAEDGTSYLGGTKRANAAMPNPSFPIYREGRTTALDYVTKRLKDLDMDIDAEELIHTTLQYKPSISQVSPNQMLEALNGKDFAQIAELMPRHEAVLTALTMKGVEDMSPAKAVKEAATSGLHGWWNKLEPKSKTAAKGVGILAAAIGVMGMIRGAGEETRDAQPRTMQSMEQYMAMRQQGVHNNHSDNTNSSMIASFRMVPNRYPTKV